MMQRHYETQAWARPVLPPFEYQPTTVYVPIPVPVSRPFSPVLAFCIGAGIGLFFIALYIVMIVAFAAGPS